MKLTVLGQVISFCPKMWIFALIILDFIEHGFRLNIHCCAGLSALNGFKKVASEKIAEKGRFEMRFIINIIRYMFRKNYKKEKVMRKQFLDGSVWEELDNLK